MSVCCDPLVEIRGQRVGVRSLLPPYGVLGLNSCPQPCLQAPLPAEPSRCTLPKVFLMVLKYDTLEEELESRSEPFMGILGKLFPKR